MHDLAAAQQLASASTAADLVPVDAEAALAAGRRLSSMAATLELAHAELVALEAAPEWKGEAGRAFERRIQRTPADTERGATVFGVAGRALTALAEAAASTRRDASAAFDLWQLAHEQSRRWQTDVTAAFDAGARRLDLDPADPGHATAQRAIAIHATARDRLNEAIELAMRTLVGAAEAAPGVDDFLSGQGALESLGGFALGVGDFAIGSAQFVSDFNTVRAVIDPGGFGSDVSDLTAGVTHLLKHPGDADDVLFDLELLREDPARWLGNILAPAILLAPLSRVASLSADATSNIAARMGRPGRFVSHHLDDLDLVATKLRLPSPSSIARLGEPALLQQALDAARRVEQDEDEDLGRYATEHGGSPEDYERKVTTVAIEGEPDLTFEFVLDTRTDEVLDPHIVTGTIPAGCGD